MSVTFKKQYFVISVLFLYCWLFSHPYLFKDVFLLRLLCEIITAPYLLGEREVESLNKVFFSYPTLTSHFIPSGRKFIWITSSVVHSLWASAIMAASFSCHCLLICRCPLEAGVLLSHFTGHYSTSLWTRCIIEMTQSIMSIHSLPFSPSVWMDIEVIWQGLPLD